LEARLQDLSERLQRGAYRAKPVRRAYIPKADGRQRPLGVPALEDKIVQRAVVVALNAIYESDFVGFSYGFRPGRSPHQALDALTVGITMKKMNWVLDADIQSFFGAPGEAGRFQRVQFPPRQGERAAPPGIEPWAHGGNDMG
jgi:RNA-directed DNA polymerase